MRHRQHAWALGLIASVLCVGLIVTTGQQAATGVHPISGRRFAPVMGFGGAEWLDRLERRDEELPDDALDAIGVPRGTVVADVGAGSGYITARLSRRVGPTGKVFATDLQPEMLALLKQRIARERLANVELVLGGVDDPHLPTNTLDLIVMVDVYHELSQPQVMLRKMRQALKPTGRLALLEYRKEDPSIPIRPEHKMSVAEAKLEIEAEGYRFARLDSRLPRQHVLVFEPLPTSQPTHAPIGVGQRLELAPGARVDAGGLSVTFVGVKNDSRCPRSVVCAWAGNAEVDLRVSANGDAHAAVLQTAHIGNALGRVTMFGRTIRLLDLTPAPDRGAVPTAAYRVSLVVE